MKVKRKFTHSPKKVIWRILLNNNLVLFEERDSKTKEVSFSCFDFTNGKPVFEGLQPGDKYWLGIENFSGDEIIFHGYRKPDMPGHQGIYVYSLSQKKIIWQSDEQNYYFSDNDIVYTFIQKFEGAHYYALERKSGKLLEEIGDNIAKIHAIKHSVEQKEDYSEYGFPILSGDPATPAFRDIKLQLTSKFTDITDIEFIEKNEIFAISCHRKSTNLFNQTLYLFTINKKKPIFEEVINRNNPSVILDSFFLYSNFLFVILDKTLVEVYQII